MSGIVSYTVSTSEILQTHSHKHAHIILPLRGRFYVNFLSQKYVLTTGEIGFVPPETEHEYRCEGLTATINIPKEMVKPGDLSFLTENCILRIDEKLSPLIRLIEQEIKSPEGSSSSLRYLFYYLYDKFVERRSAPSISYLNENFASPELSVTELAAMENYNVSYYTEWFRSHMGITPSEYLRALRIRKAKEILETTHYRILDVAMQVGYTNASSFTRAFRESEGMTPQEYRRKTK